MKTLRVLTLCSLAAFVFVMSGCQIKLDSQAMDADEYLKSNQAVINIYDDNKENKFLSPFNFAHTDFGRLILVSIDGHSEIKAVELVVQKNGTGAFVVVYYHNGKVVTHPNFQLSIDRKYLKPNRDWSIANEKAFEYRFEETAAGVLLTLDVTIENGREIKIDIRENLPEQKRYSFLAAIGADLDQVKRFPFIYLEEAGFIQVNNTVAKVEIEGKAFSLAKVPLKVEGDECYRTVYSFSPLSCFWNEDVSSASLPVIKVSKKRMEIGNAVYFFDNKSRFNEIEKVAYPVEGRLITFRFSPSFPDLSALKNRAEVHGKFCIGVDETHGVVCGKYSVSASHGEVDIKFNPEHCWQPMPGRDWVCSYHYRAKVFSSPAGTSTMTSAWRID